MTRVIITTSLREAPLQSSSGWLYVYDLQAQRILKVTEGVEPPYRATDHNPRGGMRGMRGFSFNNGELAIADYSTVYFFDRYWNLLRVCTHPSVSAIHEILYVEDGIWVTSTANDLLVKFDLSGKLNEFYYLRAQKKLMSQVGGPTRLLFTPKEISDGKRDFRSRTYFKSDLYDRVHLNSVNLSPNGRVYLSLGLIVGDYFGFLMKIKTLLRLVKLWDFFIYLNRFIRVILGFKKRILSELALQPVSGNSAVVSLGPQGDWQMHLQLPVFHNPSHSVRILNDGTGLYLATSHGSIVHFDSRGNILSNTKITDKFLRGLLVLPDGRLMIGAGNTIVIFDMTTKRKIDEFEIAKDPMSTIFEIHLLPAEFELPPDSLQKKIGRIVGFDGQSTIWESM